MNSEKQEKPEPLRKEELNGIPFFPLATVVLLPGGVLPLHLFEDRYLEMIGDCFKHGPRAIVMAHPDNPNSEPTNQFTNPPIRQVGCAGRIVAHEELADGRHNIVLRGMTRVELEEEPGGKSYRTAIATAIAEDMRPVDREDKAALLACAAAVAAIVRRAHPEFTLGLGNKLGPAKLADAIADRLLSETEVRQDVLECFDAVERVRLVTDHVSELLALLTRSSDVSQLH